MKRPRRKHSGNAIGALTLNYRGIQHPSIPLGTSLGRQWIIIIIVVIWFIITVTVPRVLARHRSLNKGYKTMEVKQLQAILIRSKMRKRYLRITSWTGALLIVLMASRIDAVVQIDHAFFIAVSLFCLSLGCMTMSWYFRAVEILISNWMVLRNHEEPLKRE
jgi:hypothetical protein